MNVLGEHYNTAETLKPLKHQLDGKGYVPLIIMGVVHYVQENRNS